MSNQEYSSLDEIIESVVNLDEVEGIYSSQIEEDLNFFDSIIYFFKSNWKEKLIFIVILIIFFVLDYFGIKGIVKFGVLTALIVYVYLKGLRYRPDILILTKDKNILIRDIWYDNNTNKVTYDSIVEYSRKELSHYFKFAELNPLFHFWKKHFRLGKDKFIINRKSWLFTKHYPTIKIVSFSQIKKLLKKRMEEAL